ncbi:MAG: hypothetical protein ACKO0Z_02255 [Betaproteobacteria bacterium]
MSGYTMQVDFFNVPVRCETDGLMISLTDLTRAGNKWRAAHNLPYMQLVQIVQSKGFADFLAVAQADMPNQELMRVEGRGNGKRTMAHILLAVYVAEQFSPEFHYRVIKTFVEGKLLEFRDHGGTEFKSLNAELDSRSADVLGKPAHKGHFIQMATLLRKRLLNEDQDWNTASVAQTHRRYEAEQTLVKLLQLGVVRDWEHLKELIEKV